ncbi:MAG: DUF1015 domain-containing protein [Clostridiales bacterium]|nr:DUF1015 domain-containing protein [Clostridiales bacterium]
MKKTFTPADVLLPRKGIDMNKWAVVSCDQFTSQRSYWEKVKEHVGDGYSTLNLILPEAYLEDDDSSERIEKINKTMREYLSEGIFETYENCYILVERSTAYSPTRVGIIGKVDLEAFCFTGQSTSIIRPTEGVVIERIPPRLAIRKNAALELPHILLLIDDKDEPVISPIYEKRDSFKKLYDFELNMNGGHLMGYLIDGNELDSRLASLFNKESQRRKYGRETNFIFAVGDGNHSLATAKTHWENIKQTLTDEEKETHPARYCLCEIESIYCEGIIFEPIHRVVFGANEDFINYMQNRLKGERILLMSYEGKEYAANVSVSTPEAIRDIQDAIDEYIASHAGVGVDYIHGYEHLMNVAEETHSVAIIMPSIIKTDLFKYVLENGVLPRKAFSMGEAEEKRYYVEARKIVR